MRNVVQLVTRQGKWAESSTTSSSTYAPWRSSWLDLGANPGNVYSSGVPCGHWRNSSADHTQARRPRKPVPAVSELRRGTIGAPRVVALRVAVGHPCPHRPAGREGGGPSVSLRRTCRANPSADRSRCLARLARNRACCQDVLGSGAQNPTGGVRWQGRGTSTRSCRSTVRPNPR